MLQIGASLLNSCNQFIRLAGNASKGALPLTCLLIVPSFLPARTRRDSSERGADLKDVPAGAFVRIVGAVIARRRPGTASGFISAEDETGISNAIVRPNVYEANKMTVTPGKFLMIEGALQNQNGVVSVKASAVQVLDAGEVDMRSHDFHRDSGASSTHAQSVSAIPASMAEVFEMDWLRVVARVEAVSVKICASSAARETAT